MDVDPKKIKQEVQEVLERIRNNLDRINYVEVLHYYIPLDESMQYIVVISYTDAPAERIFLWTNGIIPFEIQRIFYEFEEEIEKLAENYVLRIVSYFKERYPITDVREVRKPYYQAYDLYFTQDGRQMVIRLKYAEEGRETPVDYGIMYARRTYNFNILKQDYQIFEVEYGQTS